jgi:hypothetical protein
VKLDALAELERPRRLVLELPLGGEPGIQLAVRVTAGQVVEEVEGDADLVGVGAEVRVELRDVATLGGDQLLLLRGLGLRVPQPDGRHHPGGAEHGRPFEQLASRDFHEVHLRGELEHVWR